MKLKDYNNAIDWLWLAAITSLIIGTLLGLTIKGCGAEELITPETYSPQEICTAIYFAEGGKDAQYQYGIRSVSYRDTKEAREICIRSAERNRKRYTRYGYRNFRDYLRFFANRWASPQATNDPKGLNVNFYKNVKWFLENPKEINP